MENKILDCGIFSNSTQDMCIGSIQLNNPIDVILLSLIVGFFLCIFSAIIFSGE